MSDERLIVKFEKGVGGPLRTAVGELVPTYMLGDTATHAEQNPAVGPATRVHALQDPRGRPVEWCLVLANATCEGEFDGVSPWYQIAFSHIVTVRPHRSPA